MAVSVLQAFAQGADCQGQVGRTVLAVSYWTLCLSMLWPALGSTLRGHTSSLPVIKITIAYCVMWKSIVGNANTQNLFALYLTNKFNILIP